MRRLIVVAALLFAACAVPVRVVNEQAPIAPVHKFGDVGPSGSLYAYWQTNLPAVAGASATINLFDTTMGGTTSGKYQFLQRIMVVGGCNVTVTGTYQVQLLPNTSWVTAAGSNATFSFVAGSVYEVDNLVQGQESRYQITTTTAPGTCPFSVRLFFVRDLAQ